MAVKLLRPDQESNCEVIQRLRENLKREGRIIAGIKHPNIGQVYTAISDPLGIVMEWIDGPSLQDIMDSGGRLSSRSIIEIGIALADALNYVRRQDVFHRDIKPGNIILIIDSCTILKPVLVDFVARAVNRDIISLQADCTYGRVGTASYSAPEQFLNPEGVGLYTDIFALGLVLYQLLTGKMPYAWGNLPSLYPDGKFPQPDRSGIPESLYPVLRQMLSQKSEERPDAATLKEKLRDCLASEPIEYN